MGERRSEEKECEDEEEEQGAALVNLAGLGVLVEPDEVVQAGYSGISC